MARHDWFDWDDFEEGATLAFWADAYASEVEEMAEQGDSEAYDALNPGAGGDWMDVLPTPPKSAKQAGREFTKTFRKAASATQVRQMEDNIGDAEKAGHYAAMGAMGHGVGLWDFDVDDDGLPSWEPWEIRDDAMEIIDAELEALDIEPPDRARWEH
jgi:hypothetical protein